MSEFYAMTGFCAACPVRLGLCPRCGTFWFPQGGGADCKVYGVRPVDFNPVIASGRETTAPGPLNHLLNVVVGGSDR